MRRIVGLLATLSLLAGSCTSEPARGVRAAEPIDPLPTAASSERVDLAKPTFSDPTRITNPLFPISSVSHVIMLGNSDGQAMRVEVTLLPDPKVISWQGRSVKTLVSQYTAYIGGRIHEVALDRYAQADDGSVWYFGEDVFNYEDGVVADRDGTWLAGKDGPAAMIMPASPQVGDVYRPENIPGSVFEEVTVVSTDVGVDGPIGRVSGAITVKELHLDGSYEDKTFAPGYGEFSTGAGGDLEAVALALPTDATSDVSSLPELEGMLSEAYGVFGSASADVKVVTSRVAGLTAAWGSFVRRAGVPVLLGSQMTRALAALKGDAMSPAADLGHVAGTRRAALDVAQAAIDLRARYVGGDVTNEERFGLWARRMELDLDRRDAGASLGDVVVLDLILDRVKHLTDAADDRRTRSTLKDVRAAILDEDFERAAALTRTLKL